MRTCPQNPVSEACVKSRQYYWLTAVLHYISSTLNCQKEDPQACPKHMYNYSTYVPLRSSFSRELDAVSDADSMGTLIPTMACWPMPALSCEFRKHNLVRQSTEKKPWPRSRIRHQHQHPIRTHPVPPLPCSLENLVCRSIKSPKATNSNTNQGTPALNLFEPLAAGQAKPRPRIAELSRGDYRHSLS